MHRKKSRATGWREFPLYPLIMALSPKKRGPQILYFSFCFLAFHIQHLWWTGMKNEIAFHIQTLWWMSGMKNHRVLEENTWDNIGQESSAWVFFSVLLSTQCVGTRIIQLTFLESVFSVFLHHFEKYNEKLLAGVVHHNYTRWLSYTYLE